MLPTDEDHGGRRRRFTEDLSPVSQSMQCDEVIQLILSGGHALRLGSILLHHCIVPVCAFSQNGLSLICT